MNKDEALYRKWIGICQQHKGKPLMASISDDKVEISVGGDVVLSLTREQYVNATANEIIEQINQE